MLCKVGFTETYTNNVILKANGATKNLNSLFTKSEFWFIQNQYYYLTNSMYHEWGYSSYSSISWTVKTSDNLNDYSYRWGSISWTVMTANFQEFSDNTTITYTATNTSDSWRETNKINYFFKVDYIKIGTYKKIKIYSLKEIWEKLTGYLFGMIPTGERRDGN